MFQKLVIVDHSDYCVQGSS